MKVCIYCGKLIRGNTDEYNIFKFFKDDKKQLKQLDLEYTFCKECSGKSLSDKECWEFLDKIFESDKHYFCGYCKYGNETEYRDDDFCSVIKHTKRCDECNKIAYEGEPIPKYPNPYFKLNYRRYAKYLYKYGIKYIETVCESSEFSFFLQNVALGKKKAPLKYLIKWRVK